MASSSSRLDGHGVTNYSANTPSYNFTPTTTEFDDELLKRDIITFEQAMIAKGATPVEARRLNLSNQGMEDVNIDSKSKSKIKNEEDGDGDEDSSDDDSFSDDEFLLQYRSKRLEELQAAKPNLLINGEVYFINRAEWAHHVNESSKIGNRWVVVHLSYPGGEVMDSSIQSLARKFDGTKFVSIPYDKAIPNWPVNSLPTLFVYRDGEMVHQGVGIEDVRESYLEWMLGGWGVVDTDIELENDGDAKTEKANGGYKGKGIFGGMGSNFETVRENVDDESDCSD